MVWYARRVGGRRTVRQVGDPSTLEVLPLHSTDLLTLLDEAGVEPDDVALYRDESDGWRSLGTEQVGANGSHYGFQATSPGLSLFSLGATAPTLQLADVGGVTETVEVGAEVTVDATVRNQGGKAGTDTVAANARSTEPASLAFASESAGTYTLAVNGQPAGTVSVGSGDGPSAGSPDAGAGATDGVGGSLRALLLAGAVGTGLVYRRRRRRG